MIYEVIISERSCERSKFRSGEQAVFAPIHVQLGRKFINLLSNVKEVNTYVFLGIKAYFNSMY